MSPWLALLHVIGACLPVLALATWMAAWGRRQARIRDAGSFGRVWLAHVAAGTVVWVAGWLIFGRDGKMATYAALVLVAATVQWALGRSWKS